MLNVKPNIFYGCYGSNLNKDQMSRRCPYAKPVGVAYLKDYALVFDRVASIVKIKGEQVPIGVWLISEYDEMFLDRYEGYPHLYEKEYFKLDIGGKKISTMIYIKNDISSFEEASQLYINTILQGYKDFNLDTSYLYNAIDRSLELEGIFSPCLKEIKYSKNGKPSLITL